jgi:phenylacetate-CoA ligase
MPWSCGWSAIPRPDPPAAASAGDALATLIKNNLGVSVGVDVVEPDGIERSMGKMRRTIDERPAH